MDPGLNLAVAAGEGVAPQMIVWGAEPDGSGTPSGIRLFSHFIHLMILDFMLEIENFN